MSRSARVGLAWYRRVGLRARARKNAVHFFVAATVLAAVVGAFVAAMTLEGRPLVPQGSGPTLVVLAAFLIIAELNPLRWLRLHDGGEITPSWTFVFAIVFLPAPLLAIVAHASACAISDMISRKPVERTLFNVAQTCLSVSVAVLVVHGFGQLDALAGGSGGLVVWFVAAAASATATFVVNAVLTCTVLALHEGTSVRAMIRRGVFVNLLSDGILVALAPLLVIVADRSILLLFLVVVVAGLVHVNTKAVLAAEHAANHDVLTELLNRRAFTTRVEQELAGRGTHRPCALILVDLDNFKEINDRLGHQIGDAVLAEIGRRLRAGQESGRLSARLGGDEFAVFVTHHEDTDDVAATAEAIRAAIAAPCVAQGFPLLVTASIGVSVWPLRGSSFASLFEEADLAMYTAKKTGDAAKIYRHSESTVGAGRIALLSDLDDAIRNDELTLWYQPQVDLVTGRTVALEALIRWNHPRYGLVQPGEFMPLAEQTELMGPLTEQVIEIAVTDALRWRSVLGDVRVGINASARNLHDLGFPKIVEMALRRHGASPQILELEITENTVVAQPERTAAVLQSLKDLGVRLCIDDFGTGYSSLSRLRALPVQAVKVDRSFVRDICVNVDDQTIVRSIVDLATNLGLDTVAEGVETAEALEILRRYGCRYAQGYLIAAPMPFAEAVRWMTDRCSPAAVERDAESGERERERLAEVQRA